MQEVVDYWLVTAEHDRETMDVLIKNGRYSDALFFGHIILEKVLKALVVKETKKLAPYTHNLTYLAKLSAIEIAAEEMDLLDKVNEFNIRARYPKYKLEFYKKATKEYSEGYLGDINNLYKKLCQIAIS